MKIATFNANSIRSRLPIITAWLAARCPDVLCIQETKVTDEDFPVAALEQTGYHFVFSGEKKYNGVAVMSRKPLSEVVFGLDSEPRDPSRIITARLDDIMLVNTYIPQGYAIDSPKFEYKLQWLERLHRYFSGHFSPNDSILWMGDMNAAIDERDVHDAKSLWGHVCYCEAVQKGIRKIMDWGFTDVFRMHNPRDGMYSFWDYRVPNGFKRNIGWRLDYIMATRSLAEKCTDCYIDTEPRGLEKPSDHTFVVAEFASG